MISGQVLLSETSSTKEKLVLSIVQLSETIPPAEINSLKSAYGVCSSRAQTALKESGQLITGPISSLMIMVCVQVDVLPHKSAI